MKSYIFQSKRLGFRQWLPEDRIPFYELNADPEVMEYFPDVLTLDQVDAMLLRISKHIDEHGFGFFAVDLLDSGEFIGLIGLGYPRFELDFGRFVEIGWRTRKSSWGQGYATEAALATLAYGFDILKLSEIYSMTAIQNKKSEHIMQRLGMKHDRFFDIPVLPSDSPLLRHTLYKLTVNDYQNL